MEAGYVAGDRARSYGEGGGLGLSIRHNYADFDIIQAQYKWTGERANTPGPGQRSGPFDDR